MARVALAVLVLGSAAVPGAAGAAPPDQPAAAKAAPPAAAPPPQLPPSPGAPSRARDLACSLADEVGPRLAGSQGDAKAVAWALAKMKALGLSNVRAEPVKVPRWVRGPAEGELVAPFRRPLVLASLGNAVGTPPGGVEAEVVRVESLEGLQGLADDAVRGRIVFFDKVMERRADGKGYGATVAIRSRGAAEASKKGAVASIIRSVGTSGSRFPHTGGMRYPDGVAKIPALALAIPDAELLRRAVLSGRGPVRLRLSSSAQQLTDADSANVIGEVMGTKKPNEWVIISAHLDAWDLGDGAVDDAAGVGVVLDVAARLLEAPPERSVRVVLFANEENGLRGAKAYVAAHQQELARHVAALEIDSGAGRALSVRYAAGRDAGPSLAPLGAELEKRSLALAPDAEAGGADIGELTGVPLLQILQDCSRYFDVHHTADDTCDKIDPAELAQLSEVTLAVTRALSRAGVELGRRPPPKK